MDTCSQVGDSKGTIEIYTEVMIFRWDFFKNYKKAYVIANSK